MKEWQDTGIITRIGYFGEYHVWLKILFEKSGLQTVFAFGGAISRKRFCGCLDLLNILDCRIKTTKGYMALEESTLIESPRRLRQDWRTLGIFRNCLLFVNFLDVPPESSSECYGLVRDLWQEFEQGPVSSAFFPIFFRLRFVAALGYAPNLDVCGSCGQMLTQGVFLADDGQVYCEHCIAHKTFSEKKRSYHLDQASMQLMREVSILQPFPISLEDYKPNEIRRTVSAIDGFIQYHLGIKWENGGFCRI